MVHHLLFRANGAIHTSLLICHPFLCASQAHDMLCTSITKKHLAQDWKKKNETIALIIVSRTQSYEAVDVIPIALIQTALKAISYFPQMLVAEYFPRIHFERFCLSLDEVRAQKENHHVIVYVWINFALCTCLSGTFWTSACLLCFCPRLSPTAMCDILLWNTTEQKTKEGNASKASFKPSICTCKPFHSHPTLCHTKL